MIGGTMLIHGEKWAATVEDGRTVRIIRDELTRALERHQEIADTIMDPEGRAEFLSMFEDQVRRCEAVIATCNQRLENWT